MGWHSRSAAWSCVALLLLAGAWGTEEGFRDFITDEDMEESRGLFDGKLPDKSGDDKWMELSVGVPEGMRVWGKVVEETGAMTVRVAGSLEGVPVEAMVETIEGIDFEFRKSWDKSCLKLEKLASQGSNDIITWLVDFPWPMSDREYVLRRRLDNLDDGSSVSISRVVTESSAYIALDPSLVRIDDFVQYAAARPLPDGKGVHFHLLYRNDLKAPVPKWVVTWFSKVALPAYLLQIVSVAKKHAKRILEAKEQAS